MKELVVKKVNITEKAPWDEVLKALENAEWNIIDAVNWSKFDYCPQVHFRMVYNNTSFLLHYKVKEQSVRAIATVDNGEVWKDSCVEFFVTPANDGIYYNFEFNCIGTCLLAAGPARNGREAASPAITSLIRRLPSLGRHPFEERKGDTEWDIKLVIPFACLFKHPGFSPNPSPTLPEGEGVETEKIGTVRANFYKCGDGLSVPHYISWNPIDTEKPDFHRPEFFGIVRF